MSGRGEDKASFLPSLCFLFMLVLGAVFELGAQVHARQSGYFPAVLV